MSMDFLRQLALDKRKQDLTANLAKLNRGGSKWNPLTTPVDFYLLNGIRSPGIASFPQLEASEKWEMITGPGLTGSVPIFRGIECSEFDVIHKLYTVEDWDQLHVFLPLVQRAPRGKRPQAKRILHPLLDLYDPPVRAVVKTTVKLPSIPDDKGVYTFVVRYTEYYRPKPQQAKPEAAKPEPTKDPWEKVIDDKAGEVQKLGKWLDDNK
jgi:hypothetical protein